MKFTSLLSVVLIFTLSAANAEREQAVLQFLPAPRIFPPWYIIHANFLSSRTSCRIQLRTKEPNWVAEPFQTTQGVVDYVMFQNGRYDAVINDNDAKGGEKTFRIDLTGSGGEFHYEGSSVTDEWIENLQADGDVSNFGDDDLRYSYPRFYRNRDRYFYKN
ncbi:hypothetical protein G6F70_008995 [Rhizopus microsporus]|uniref:Uncharacterized protein n=2 Tax=Rhizopus TaxID=4842 RepID=A0A367J1T1_RHIAZ|nr:hypothetical protein G6F71_008956 [Rhizopus microsporus]RCH83897.1 hypothetical protein CU097_004434 [Rhizopus azygosporus]KAG1193876.1 hypothetical protein G6F70_008995 [Rhizopus microsporus]KAG1214160.1 hypothetical protein G6F69_002193 [Rhizopus microsporus]KAG1226496.1 hypothetical protein G6F67_008959 [Rhizopus microsporus]